MKRKISSVCAGLLVVALAFASERYGAVSKVVDPKPAPSTEMPPSTKKDGVIKPETDVDPQIEKAPPNPVPDPANKDVIKPPQSGPEPK